MKITTKIYECEYNGEIDTFIVEEIGKRDFATNASYMVGYLEESDDMSIWIEYYDGSVYYENGYDCGGKFKKTGIKFGCIDNGSTYEVTGEYVFNHGVVQAA